MTEMIIRFLVGGVVVSCFAMLGEVFRPKSFAGVFGAAPSIGLATIGITIVKHGHAYAALEARSMIFGAIAFFIYACACSFTLMQYRRQSLGTAITLIPLWFVVSFALIYLIP